jgi:hypothetical protein
MLKDKFSELEKTVEELEEAGVDVSAVDVEANHKLAAADPAGQLFPFARSSNKGSRSNRDEKRKQLFDVFPDLWERAHLFDCRKPKNNDGEHPPKEVRNFETNRDKEEEKKIAPLVPGMPLWMGFMYNNVNPVIMHLLISLYGSQAFVKAFGKKAESISLSSLDKGNMETFEEAVEPILPVPHPNDDDKAKEKKKEQWELLKKKAEEESLLNEHLFMSHVKDTLLTKAEIGNLFSEARLSRTTSS